MLNNILMVKIWFALMLAVPFAATAQDQPGPITLNGDVKAVKVITEADGSERTELVELGVVVPGDRLVFRTSFLNTGNETVSNFDVTNPLHAAIRLSSEADPSLTVSVDGGDNWGLLTELTVMSKDGESRPASHSDVTHIRWTLGTIAPGESGTLEYPAIIR
jgi:uncharacterized repeat protein (TIGR01451 family)